MKKFKIMFLIFLFIVLVARPCFGAPEFTTSIDDKGTYKNAYRWTGRPREDVILRWAQEVEDRLDATVASEGLYFDPTDDEPGDDEGMFYYDLSEHTFKFRNASAWVAFDTGTAGNALDAAYNAGNTIDVDGDAVTLDNDTTDNNVLLILTQDDTTGNTDAMTIVNTNTGDAIQISPGATTGGGINIIGKASGTTPLIILDSSTSNMYLNDNKGQLLIQSDYTYNHTGATSLMVYHVTGQPKDSAEGFLARFVSSGTARTNATAVEIEVPATQPALAVDGIVKITGQNGAGGAILQITNIGTSGDADGVTIAHSGDGAALQITPGETTSVAFEIVGIASSSVTIVDIDGATNDWIGGSDDVAMVEIRGGSTANANAGGGLFAIISATNPAASSEGFLARFIHTGTATTTAYAVQIMTTATTPCLQLNNQMTITGASSSAGILLDITSTDTSTDTVTLVGVGTGDVLQVTADATTATGIKVLGAINGAAALVEIDGATINWIGANDVGMLTLLGDTIATNAGSTLCFIQTEATPYAASEGFLLRLEHKTGSAVTNAYAMGISTIAETPCLHLNNELVITGAAAAGQLLTIVSQDADDNTASITGVGSGSCLVLVPNATGAIGLTVTAKASGTTADVYIDAQAGWIGAENVGLVTIISDSPLTDDKASLFVVKNATTQIKTDAQGHLARFVDAAAARTGAFAVAIETVNTTPCLIVNNQIKIDGTDNTGILLLIDGEDSSGNSDSIVQTHDGDGAAYKMTLEAPASVGLLIIGDAAGTHPAISIDLETGAAWAGAAATGAIQVVNDGLLAADATLLRLENKGKIASANDGACLEIIDSGAATGTSYAVRIASTSNEALHVDTGTVLIDETLLCVIGNQNTPQDVTANTASQAGSLITVGTRIAIVTGTTTGVTDFVVIPESPLGARLTIICEAGGAFEIRTVDASDDEINDVDADGTQEYLVADGDIVDLICTESGVSWVAISHTVLGAAKTVIPN